MNHVTLSRRDPARFFRHALGWEPWSKQIEIAEAVRDAITGAGRKRVAVRSSNGVGKTAIAARLMLWALCCFPESIALLSLLILLA